MESDSSLILLSENSSFQILDKSDSFVVLNSSIANLQLNEELASHYDAEDEWLQLETGSVVSSLGSVIKADGSIMSEYSILDNVHATALSEGGKLIKTRPDIYVEDQAMRKILEYISMFYDEVASCLKSSRSSQSLMSSQVFKEDWEITSLIDLDDISSDVLGLVLDTLEEFGMYKLCLIVCNRYNLASRLGRYIVSLATRYSNLSEIKFTDIKGGVQVQRAAIAYTAVHNMYEMINPEYLSLKEEDGRNLGIEAFRGLILLGYWKKTVYVMDYGSSLAVTNSFGDFRNFKRVYLAKEGAKEFDSNLENFTWLKFVKSPTPEIYKLALDSIITNFNAFKPITLNKNYLTYTEGEFPVFPEQFSCNKAFWEFINRKIPKEDFENQLKNIIKTVFHELKSNLPIDEIRVHDIFTVFIHLIFCEDQAIVEVINCLSFDDFEMFLHIYNIICQELNGKIRGEDFNALYSILSPFAIRKIIQHPVLIIYPYATHVLVHRSSIIFNSFYEKPDKAVFPDLEANYLLMPIVLVRSTVFDIIVGRLMKILNLRASYQLMNTTDELYTRANIFGEIWFSDFIWLQSQNTQYKLKSYNYCKMDSKVLTTYKSLQMKLSDILQLGETDYYSEIFIKSTRNHEIRSIERQIKKIERLNNKNDVLGREESILKLCEISSWSSHPFPITKIARQAFLTVMQVYTLNSENAPNRIAYRYMWLCYNLSKITKQEIFYLEMLRNRYKKIIYHDKKVSKSNPIYEICLGYADIDIYFQYGQMEEVINTVQNMLDADYSAFELDLKANLMYKATLAWAISNSDTFTASLKAKEILKPLVKSQETMMISGVSKKKISPNELLIYIFTGIKDLCLIENLDSYKRLLGKIFYECLYIILSIWKDEHDLASILKNPENWIYLNVSRGFIAKNDEEDTRFTIKFEDDVKNPEKYHVFEENVIFTVESRKNNKDIYRELDNAWISEVKKIASDLNISCLIKKKRKLFRKSNRNIIDKTMTVLVNKDTRGKVLISSILKYFNELIIFFYGVYLNKALDFHHILTKFEYAGNLMEKIMKGLTGDEEVGEMQKEIEEELEDFRSWKKAVSPEFSNPKPVYKKKFKMRWPLKLKYGKHKRR
ncbi:hypothetical protein SteCoe_10388 [Stentor coeruleus]|uniref:Uncharacterized protein n=1 Tax=Stentor coeruleus TaxID=5963 RepID=A0A1R2CFN6_9CILI|nr:hypothetical protein SteCoe_10388 [Stentor coeruleus]